MSSATGDGPAVAVLVLTLGMSATVSPSADLQSRTATAFDRYAAETERQTADTLNGTVRFLWIDAQSPTDRQAGLRFLRSGGVLIERLETRSEGKRMEAPGGMIHHWMGAVFVPGASVDQALALLKDYDRHADIYKPVVARSRLVEQHGDDFRVFLRFSMTNVITVVVNSDHQAHFGRPSPTRAYSRSVSTRIAEVADPDTPQETEKPAGRGGGYLWRLNSYWRFLERDGGTYVQCESITLSRSIPTGLGWLIGPYVTSIPKESLEFTLQTTRVALVGR